MKRQLELTVLIDTSLLDGGVDKLLDVFREIVELHPFSTVYGTYYEDITEDEEEGDGEAA